jgi:hypothetical protein
MPQSWNEIRSRAVEFSKRWEHETSEDTEAKAFWTELLNVFGIDRKRVASFAEPVKKLGNEQGYIDLFWKDEQLADGSKVISVIRQASSITISRGRTSLRPQTNAWQETINPATILDRHGCASR